ncbi:MAG: cation:proton antiporter, partial [bacterium]
FAEILLFVLIGAQFNFTALGGVAVKGLVIILIGLLGRSVGVLISLMGSGFKLNEKLFCVASYLPKATVQAAIAAIPLSMGIKDGDVILAIATLSIILTTPLGIVAPRLFRP